MTCVVSQTVFGTELVLNWGFRLGRDGPPQRFFCSETVEAVRILCALPWSAV